MALSRRPIVALAALAALGVAGVHAQTPVTPATPAPAPEAAAELGAAKLQGSGTLRFMGLRIYDARLWLGATAVGADWTAAPLALELDYARSLGTTASAAAASNTCRRVRIFMSAAAA